ncbi:MAG: hypothetical protein A3E21_02535 [Sulfurimonas sp. RIFCSPHIGHO2_12_FULL_36_9]|uniref:hypothetical protein n=1 Tax=Sulfurimonas sp. RIFCSPLOWO2_12_36_12 TaxID=1802253 RepID=UPI0008B12565|nr:hypothetical protein [Sulfurimonas sp. RIFCSPLOWO2_12_36_12]OHD97510.1 MAG: hypothetical protein A3E21_02535 [Sulfurimonas sp. RIFCSPHIGHO2_12_FULL_36_9]OHD99220.1 MAG: hypothetical protein A3J26_00955 [Sulfurimonas sp. RIFCSPLOWO2_02_FULL_36_28]OHE02955.1 MAG: hypothetical protein A2W82_07500 [Sulfurimonas sp. RIFCSPLOWO2_12_36_12]OHE07397.1 MAG: hypothetical protein A3K14_08760 [Sulfurimonas sp. RIFCSPLOWO2_12_FULL_36_74]
MKLKTFEQKHNYEFVFVFENGECKQANIEELVAKYLKPDELNTATINNEWDAWSSKTVRWI